MATSAINDDNVGALDSRLGGRQCLAVRRLSLTDFRCYDFVRLETDERPVVLTGPNGAGKTNLLEAISFLTPGRGLRRAKLSDVGRAPVGNAWAVAAKFDRGGESFDIGTGCRNDDNNGGRDKRVIKIDGAIIKGQSELGRHTSAQWLTPQMDRLFTEGAAGRRRFVDRLIFGLDPDHAGPVAAYEHSLRSRSKLLREGGGDPNWLSSIEESMARHGVAVAVRRLEAVDRLAKSCRHGSGPFPGADVAMTGELEAWLKSDPALSVEDRMRARLAETRQLDTAGASIGPHRSDFVVHHAHSGTEAGQCSTGEQKALLIGIVLAAARLQAEERGHTPLLLMDEMSAHLDEDRRRALFDMICQMGAQAWITGTDADIYKDVGERAQHFQVRDATIERH